LAAPFFSIEVPGAVDDSVKSDIQIDEIYFTFMQLFPAYSVRKIEDELSWREVKRYMEISNQKITTKTRIDRIENMIEKSLNVSFDDRAQNDEATINLLKGLGWLP